MRSIRQQLFVQKSGCIISREDTLWDIQMGIQCKNVFCWKIRRKGCEYVTGSGFGYQQCNLSRKVVLFCTYVQTFRRNLLPPF